MKVEFFRLPAHWASALINSDSSGLDDDDTAALDLFENWMVSQYNQCWPLSCDNDPQFERWHDAAQFGVLACVTLTFSFDVTPVL